MNALAGLSSARVYVVFEFVQSILECYRSADLEERPFTQPLRMLPHCLLRTHSDFYQQRARKAVTLGWIGRRTTLDEASQSTKYYSS